MLGRLLCRNHVLRRRRRIERKEKFERRERRKEKEKREKKKKKKRKILIDGEEERERKRVTGSGAGKRLLQLGGRPGAPRYVNTLSTCIAERERQRNKRLEEKD